MTAHEEMLAAAKRIVREKKKNEFFSGELINYLKIAGSVYKEKTINAELLRCCINCPRKNETPHDYFERIERGKFRLLKKHLE